MEEVGHSGRGRHVGIRAAESRFAGVASNRLGSGGYADAVPTDQELHCGPVVGGLTPSACSERGAILTPQLPVAPASKAPTDARAGEVDAPKSLGRVPSGSQQGPD